MSRVRDAQLSPANVANGVFSGVIFLALILNHFPLLPDLYTLLTSQTSAPLLLIAALYFGGVWALPSGDGENNNNTSWASLLGPFFALQTVSNRIGTYFKSKFTDSLASPRLIVTQLVP
jgi:hypothetical protein